MTLADLVSFLAVLTWPRAAQLAWMAVAFGILWFGAVCPWSRR